MFFVQLIKSLYHKFDKKQTKIVKKIIYYTLHNYRFAFLCTFKWNFILSEFRDKIIKEVNLMITKIFLFITFIGMVAGLAMLISPDEEKFNVSFFVTCLINTFFSVLNLLSVPPNDYVKLIFSLGIILFGLGGIILRFLPVKQAIFSPVIVFVSMLAAILSVFRV